MAMMIAATNMANPMMQPGVMRGGLTLMDGIWCSCRGSYSSYRCLTIICPTRS
jgi:hypothetical protein